MYETRWMLRECRPTDTRCLLVAAGSVPDLAKPVAKKSEKKVKKLPVPAESEVSCFVYVFFLFCFVLLVSLSYIVLKMMRCHVSLRRPRRHAHV